MEVRLQQQHQTLQCCLHEYAKSSHLRKPWHVKKFSCCAGETAPTRQNRSFTWPALSSSTERTTSSTWSTWIGDNNKNNAYHHHRLPATCQIRSNKTLLKWLRYCINNGWMREQVREQKVAANRIWPVRNRNWAYLSWRLSITALTDNKTESSVATNKPLIIESTSGLSLIYRMADTKRCKNNRICESMIPWNWLWNRQAGRPRNRIIKTDWLAGESCNFITDRQKLAYAIRILCRVSTYSFMYCIDWLYYG